MTVVVEDDDKSVHVSALCRDSQTESGYTPLANMSLDDEHPGISINTTENTGIVLSPTLVEVVDARTTDNTRSEPVISDSLKLATPDDDDNNTNCNNFSALPLLPSNQTEKHVVALIPVAVVKEAQNVAQSIRVTQAVFEQHGLDASIATEWAMRRQESELSVCETE